MLAGNASANHQYGKFLCLVDVSENFCPKVAPSGRLPREALFHTAGPNSAAILLRRFATACRVRRQRARPLPTRPARQPRGTDSGPLPAKLSLFDSNYFDGGRTRARTLDPLIKSQLLYQLSYAPIELAGPGPGKARHVAKAGLAVQPKSGGKFRHHSCRKSTASG